MSNPVKPLENGDIDAASRRDRRWAMCLLIMISTLAFIDRSILNTVGQAIKDDLGITDLQLGLLGGIAFSLLYGILGVPVARLAERRSRVAIISAAVATWSAMTALCGLAGSFTHLLLARIGVGIGEAGANAPAQSLLADYYPPHRRATAIGILGLATPLGLVVGGIGGAYAAEQFGWRAAFLVVGIPGLLVAVIAAMTMREPARGLSEGRLVDKAAPPFSAVVRKLRDSGSFRHILCAAILTNFIGYSVISFTHPYFVRAYGMSYTDAALAFALMNGISVSGGYLMGGFVTDRLARRDLRYYGWFPAVCMCLAGPGYALGFLQESWQTGLAILVFPGLFSAAWYAPTYAVTQNLVEPRMRASAVAVLALAMSIVGLSLGPVVTGALSDHFAAGSFQAGNYLETCPATVPALIEQCRAASTVGVRWALIAVVSLFFWAAAHFILAARHMRIELDTEFSEPGKI